MPAADVGAVPVASQPEKNALAPVGTSDDSRSKAKSLVALVAVNDAPDWEWVATVFEMGVPDAVDPGVRQVLLS